MRANVVVCIPLPCAFEITSTRKFIAGSITLIKEDFPTPECPAINVVLSFKIFLIAKYLNRPLQKYATQYIPLACIYIQIQKLFFILCII